jgi:protein SDA1
MIIVAQKPNPEGQLTRPHNPAAPTDEEKMEEEWKFQQETKDLNLLVSRVKKDPDGFHEEMIKLIKKYTTVYNKFKRNPTNRNVDLAKLSIFLCQVFEFYRSDLKFLIESISSLLENYAAQMHFLNRQKALQSLIILSKKGFWKCEEAVKFYGKLLLLEDKNLRELVSKHIVALIKKHDYQGKNSSIHRHLTDFFQKMITEGEDNLGKRLLRIMIRLYTKKIWRDNKMVNIIGNACLSTYHKTSKLACMFFMETTEKIDEELDSSESEEDDDDYVTNFYKVNLDFLTI